MKNTLYSCFGFILLLIVNCSCYATLNKKSSTEKSITEPIENFTNINLNKIDKSLTEHTLEYQLSNSHLIKQLIETVNNLTTQISKNHVLNIVTIDVEKIIENSVAIENIKNKISDIAIQIKTEANIQQEAFNKKAEMLYKNKSNMSQKDFKREVEKLDEEMHQIRFAIEQKNNALQKAETDAVNSVHDAITKIIHKISKDNNLDLVLYKPMVLFNKDDFNMTNKVIEILNESMNNIPINYKLEE